MSINAINSAINNPATASLQTPVADQKAGDFSSLLKAYTEQMNVEHHQASKAAVALATGKGGNTSETLLAIQKADLSFQMMLSVRNKLVDAYREVMRMQV